MASNLLSMDEFGTKWEIPTKSNRYFSSIIGTEADKTWNGDFYFIVGSDPQFGLMDWYQNPDYNPEKADWTEEIISATLAVDKINKLSPKPRFFVICGDLSNEFPENSSSLKIKQINDFKKIFSKVNSDIALICVCGNHDVGNSPTIESINNYHNDFGDDYFSFWCGGIFFIVLNSQYFKNAQFIQELTNKQEKWLDEQLHEADGHMIVCFSHIPWFIETPDEKEDYFNIPYETRIRILEKLNNAGVRYFFCGHLHKNERGFYKEMELIITSAIGLQLGSDKSGIRIVKVMKDKIQHSYYAMEDIPDIVFDSK